MAGRTFVRLARETDRPTVLAFTEHTWEWGDYPPLVWDRWLAEPGNRLLVAAGRQGPVGMAHVVMAAPGEAWFEGLRVDPEFRERGIATGLTRRCLREAIKLGAGVARFITAGANEPVHRIAAGVGFERVAVIIPCRSGVLSGGLPADRPQATDTAAVFAFLSRSEVLSAMAGVLNSGWRFRSLNETALTEAVAQGLLRVVKRSGAVAGVAVLVPSRDETEFNIGFVDGETEALPGLALGLSSEAAALGAARVTAWVPDIPRLKTALVAAGFQPTPEDSLWLFQRALWPRLKWV